MIDLDGTLASYDGWKGNESIGHPLPGAREAIAELRAGCKCYIYTARDVEAKPHIQAWCERHRIQVDGIICGRKPPAIAYIDDRAVPFRGDWKMAIDETKRLAERRPPLNEVVALARRVTELDAENARLKAALERIAAGIPEGDQECRECEGAGCVDGGGGLAAPCGCTPPMQPAAVAAEALEGEQNDA